ncbi:PfkB carbohydrate kinase family protein [Nitzschia inconspicua]|uniref:Adenosine kinase n=1 Tax=Nitzschia inconspicua TaxID=303405 RepID=A0A9K3Q7C2_9STRA|nr:PfkB carbohydrate kinase family protein [Nitzschia inconspicua]
MSKFEGSIMGMGNPLLDISATVGQDLLDKYEIKLDSAILAEEKHQPLFKELIEKYNPKYIAGGATQNTIRVAQWMMPKQPNQTAYMGCVGNDEYAKKLEECASADGVLVHYMKDETTPTGKCAALIKDGERALVTNLDAANNFKPSHLETEKAKEIVEAAKCYYIAGFFLTVSVDSLVQVAEHALANKKTFCLNLSAPFIVDFFGEQLSTALPYADFLFANESEATAFGKKHQLGEELKQIALATAAMPKKDSSRPRTVIFTQGSQSTIVACDGKVSEYAVEPLAKELLVDTNGAGDAFVGGFLSQLVNGKDIEACVKAGHWAAKYIIQQSGTQFQGSSSYEA